MIISWVPYFIDFFREQLYYTSNAAIIVDARSGHESSMAHESSKDDQPTLVTLRITRPERFKHGSGQWLYIKVPSIDPFWHPFSLASCSSDK